MPVPLERVIVNVEPELVTDQSTAMAFCPNDKAAIISTVARMILILLALLLIVLSPYMIISSKSP